MANPTWFIEQDYLASKLKQLKDNGDTAHTVVSVKAAIEAAGFTTYTHFTAFGAAERTSPNALFNATEYLAAKAKALSVPGGKVWTVGEVAAAFEAAKVSPWDHFTKWGAAEGINPSNAFDVSSYFDAKVAQLNASQVGKVWTVAEVKAAFTAAGLNPISHYQQFGSNESLTVTPVPAAEQVTPDPRDTGLSFTLTTDANTFTGTAKNDTITATTATLGEGDVLVDTTSTDNDVIKLTATAAVVKPASATITGFEKLEVNWDAFSDATVDLAGFNGLREVSVSTAKLGNMGNLTVNTTGAAKVIAGAGITGNLTVNNVTTGSVETGSAKVVAVNVTRVAGADETVTVKAGAEATTINVGSGAFDAVTAFDSATVTAGAKTTGITVVAGKSATVTSGAATTTINTTSAAANIDATATAAGAVIAITGTTGTVDTATVKLANDASVNVVDFTALTEKVILDVAAGKAVTLNNGAGTVEVKGAGDVTLKGLAANLTGDTVTKANTGKLNVELTDTSVAAFNSTNVAADSIKLVAAASAALTAKSGQNLEVAGLADGSSDIAVGAFAGAGTLADTLNVKLTSAKYDAITNGANTGLLGTDVDFETLTIEAAAPTASGAASNPELTISSIAAGATNTVVLKGTNDVLITTGAATTAKVIDAAAMIGSLTINGALAATAVNGATGVNTIGFAAIAAGQAATFVGQAGNDVITLDSTEIATPALPGPPVVPAKAAGQATFVTGAGNDTVNVTNAIAGVLSVQAGDGDDVVSLGAATTGTLVLEFGSGNDTLKIGNADHSGAASLIVTGLENIEVAGATAALSASVVSGQALTVKSATGGYAANTLTVKGHSANATTIDLSKLAATDSATTGVKLAALGGTGADTITGSSGADLITTGGGNDILFGGAGADTFTITPTAVAPAAVAKVTVTDFKAGEDILVSTKLTAEIAVTAKAADIVTALAKFGVTATADAVKFVEFDIDGAGGAAKDAGVLFNGNVYDFADGATLAAAQTVIVLTGLSDFVAPATVFTGV